MSSLANWQGRQHGLIQVVSGAGYQSYVKLAQVSSLTATLLHRGF